MAKRNIPAGITSVGFQTITQTNSTAVGLNTTCIVGKLFHVSVETQNARYRVDGTSPAATTGVLLLTTNSPYWIEAPGTNLKFIKVTGGTSKISVQAYKYKGE
jgi:hypothetical protein